MLRVTDYIADYVYKLGVHEVFMVAGGGMMFLTDGIAQHPYLKAICNHHEQASAMAVLSYAKYNENFGVAYVTTGCGGTNAITGVLHAWQDSVPCLFVSGQSKREETVRNSGLSLRQLGVQEADIIPIVSSITKYAVMINDPQMIAYHLDKAIYLAKSGRPGPVWLDVPLDVQGAVIDEEHLPRFRSHGKVKNGEGEPTQGEVQLIRSLLGHSKRPVLLAGQGIRLSKSVPEFQTFVESHQIPVVVSRLGIDLLPSDHPLFIGCIGEKGTRSGNFAVQNADLVIAVGSRLSISSTGHNYKSFAREAKLIVIDIDAEEHRKHTVKIDTFVNCDAKQFLARMNQNPLQPPDTKEWVKRCQEWKRKYPSCLPQYVHEKGGVNVYFFVDCLSKRLKEDSVVVADAGSAVYVPPQCIQLKKGQRYITSGGQAEMGYTLPACIGISFARKGGEVIGITGDGSFQLNIQELQTIVHHGLPIKLFVWNNDGYLSIRATQSKYFQRRFIGTDPTSGVSFPDARKIAKAYGLKYFRASDHSTLGRVIQKVLDFPKAAICEVMCLRDQEIIPTVASLKKEDGTMVSKPLEDMYPFLDREEFRREMIIKPIDEKD